MKVIDKRTKKNKDKFEVGDVVCYYDSPNDKWYSLITEVNDRIYLIDFNSDYVGMDEFSGEDGYGRIDTLIYGLRNQWKHVEKVNAHIVITD